jgi:hypothetical protein
MGRDGVLFEESVQLVAWRTEGHMSQPVPQRIRIGALAPVLPLTQPALLCLPVRISEHSCAATYRPYSDLHDIRTLEILVRSTDSREPATGRGGVGNASEQLSCRVDQLAAAGRRNCASEAGEGTRACFWQLMTQLIR